MAAENFTADLCEQKPCDSSPQDSPKNTNRSTEEASTNETYISARICKILSTLQLFFALEAIVANSVIVQIHFGQKREYSELASEIIHGPAYWCSAIFIIAALLGLITAKKRTKIWVTVLMIISIISAILSIQVLYQGVHGIINIYKVKEDTFNNTTIEWKSTEEGLVPDVERLINDTYLQQNISIFFSMYIIIIISGIFEGFFFLVSTTICLCSLMCKQSKPYRYARYESSLDERDLKQEDENAEERTDEQRNDLLGNLNVKIYDSRTSHTI